MGCHLRAISSHSQTWHVLQTGTWCLWRVPVGAHDYLCLYTHVCMTGILRLRLLFITLYLTHLVRVPLTLLLHCDGQSRPAACQMNHNGKDVIWKAGCQQRRAACVWGHPDKWASSSQFHMLPLQPHYKWLFWAHLNYISLEKDICLIKKRKCVTLGTPYMFCIFGCSFEASVSCFT